LEDSITTLLIAGCWLRIGKKFLYPAVDITHKYQEAGIPLIFS